MQYPIKIDTHNGNVTGDASLLNWVHVVIGSINQGGAPGIMAARAINAMVIGGWIPPALQDDQTSNAIDDAAVEVADLMLRSMSCSDEEIAGIRAMTVEAIQRYKALKEGER